MCVLGVVVPNVSRSWYAARQNYSDQPSEPATCVVDAFGAQPLGHHQSAVAPCDVVSVDRDVLIVFRAVIEPDVGRVDSVGIIGVVVGDGDSFGGSETSDQDVGKTCVVRSRGRAIIVDDIAFDVETLELAGLR